MNRKFKITVISTQECFYCNEDNICQKIEQYFSIVRDFIFFSIPDPNALLPSVIRIGDFTIATIEVTFNHYFSKCIFTSNYNRTALTKVYSSSFVIHTNKEQIVKNRYEVPNTPIKINIENVDYEKTYSVFMYDDTLPEYVIKTCTKLADIVFEKHGRTWFITKDSSNVFEQRKIIFKD